MKIDKEPLTELDVTHRQPNPPTVRDIVRHYLTDRGHDGMCNPDAECGCGIDDLMPCDCNPFGCQPARRTVNEYGEETYVMDDQPRLPERITGGFYSLCADNHGILIADMKDVPVYTCPNCGQTMPGNGLGGPLYYHDCKVGATVECACCHQVVGISHAVYQNGQELCLKCAE